MSTTRRMVVVGGGTAGAAAVAELRHHGFDGAITLICGCPTEVHVAVEEGVIVVVRIEQGYCQRL